MLIAALLLAPVDAYAETWPPKTRRTSIVMTRTVTTRPLNLGAVMPGTGVATAEVTLTSVEGEETVVLTPDGY